MNTNIRSYFKGNRYRAPIRNVSSRHSFVVPKQSIVGAKHQNQPIRDKQPIHRFIQQFHGLYGGGGGGGSSYTPPRHSFVGPRRPTPISKPKIIKKPTVIHILSNSSQDTSANLSKKFNIRRQNIYTGNISINKYNKSINKPLPINRIENLNTRNDTFKQPLLIEPAKISKARSNLNFIIRNKSPRKKFLNDIKNTSPKLFDNFISGKLQVTSSVINTPRHIVHTKQNIPLKNGKFKTNNFTTEVGRRITTRNSLVNPDINKSRNTMLLSKEHTKDLFIANNKGKADFKNTTLKYRQNDKRISEFYKRPVSQQSVKEINLLEQNKKDLIARFKLNPFVTVDKNNNFVFTSARQGTVAKQTIINQSPSRTYKSFNPTYPASSLIGQFNRGRFDVSSNRPFNKTEFNKLNTKQQIGRVGGLFAAKISQPSTFVTGVKTIIKKPLTSLGVSKPVIQETSNIGGNIVHTIPFFIGGTGLAKGAGVVLVKTSGVVRNSNNIKNLAGAVRNSGVIKTIIGSSKTIANKVGQTKVGNIGKVGVSKIGKVLKNPITKSPSSPTGLTTIATTIGGGIVAKSAYDAGNRGFSKTHTTSGTLAFAGLDVAKSGVEIAMLNSIFKSGASGLGKSFTSIPSSSSINKLSKSADNSIILSKKIKQGKDVTVVTNKGYGFTGVNNNKLTTVTEHRGVVKLPTGENIPFSGASSSSGKINKLDKLTKQLPITHHKIIINNKPTQFTSTTEITNHPGGGITSNTLSSDSILTKAHLNPRSYINSGSGNTIINDNSQINDIIGTSTQTGNILKSSISRPDTFFRGVSTTQPLTTKVSRTQFTQVSVKSTEKPNKIINMERDRKLFSKGNLHQDRRALSNIHKTKHIRLDGNNGVIQFSKKSTGLSLENPTSTVRFNGNSQISQQKEFILSHHIDNSQVSNKAKTIIQEQKSKELTKSSKEFKGKSEKLAKQRNTELNKRSLSVAANSFTTKLKSLLGFKSSIKPIKTTGSLKIIKPFKEPKPIKKSEPFKEPKPIKQQEPIKTPVHIKKPKPFKEPKPIKKSEPFKEPTPIGKGLPGLPSGQINFGGGVSQDNTNRYINGLIHNPIGSLYKK